MVAHGYWMAKAVAEAGSAAADGAAPVGALVVVNGEVLGAGHNTKASERRGFAHAELLMRLPTFTAAGRPG